MQGVTPYSYSPLAGPAVAEEGVVLTASTEADGRLAFLGWPASTAVAPFLCSMFQVPSLPSRPLSLLPASQAKSGEEALAAAAAVKVLVGPRRFAANLNPATLDACPSVRRLAYVHPTGPCQRHFPATLCGPTP